ncbi:MAG: amidase [Solirubrobacterales bacterium]|nr:MAG: amidase [Solirubrobacterales bacterium]
MSADELAFAGIAAQAARLRARELSARELVECYLERIARIDPKINAYRVVLGERALAEADQAQARLQGGDERPLLGVPVAIKDDIDVAGEVTAFGTRAYGAPATADAEVVSRLRAAGAIVIGKTNVPELTIWPFAETVTHGITRNPWNLERTPGGSSAGAAAAVAAGLAGAALGSDGAGSIRIPAAWCGLFGIKPQRGTVPTAPKREPWHGMATWGPITRTVRDAGVFMDAIGAAPAAGQSFEQAAAQPPQKLRIALSTGLIPGQLGRLDDAWREAAERTADTLRELGHEVVERDPPYSFGMWWAALQRYLRGIHDDARAMEHPERLERRTRGMALLGATATPGALARARAMEKAHHGRLAPFFAEHDLLLTPALARPAPRIGQYEGRGAFVTLNLVARLTPYTPLWNHTGQPACVVPAGFDAADMPVAAQLVGRMGGEATLLSIAGQLESARPWTERRPTIA